MLTGDIKRLTAEIRPQRQAIRQGQPIKLQFYGDIIKSINGGKRKIRELDDGHLLIPINQNKANPLLWGGQGNAEEEKPENDKDC